MSVFMYGHNGRHFRLAALLKRPAGRLAALQKSRFKDRAGRGCRIAKPPAGRGEPARETEPTEVTDTEPGICTAGVKVGSVRVSVYGESGSRLFERFTEEFLC